MALLDNGRCQRKRSGSFRRRDCRRWPCRACLALAIARLAPQGFRIALVDAEPVQGSGVDDARALALTAATRNLLSALDLWPELAPSAQAIEAIEITDSPLDASLRPHFLGFDAELKDDGARRLSSSTATSAASLPPP